MQKCLISLVFLLFTKLAFADEALLNNISVTASPNTQVTLTFDKPTPYKAFTLPNPSRLVIDIQKAQYKMKGAADFSGTDITDFRHGIQNGSNLRIVFDLKQPMHFSVQTTHNDNFQIMLNLASSNAIVTPKVTDAPSSTTPSEVVAVSPTVSSNTTSSSVPKKQTFIVIIDAGHGGKDSGAIGPGGTKEKNVTLAIAKDLQELVNAQSGMKAVLTRSNDTYVGLRQRLMIARKAKGDMFIAIHADAFNQPNAEGASVYALSLHGSSSEAALWLAQKENYSELSGIDLNGIQDQDAQIRSVLIDLSQTAAIGASLQVGRDVIQQLGTLTELHHDVVEQAPFMVLKSPDIPSILVETGFITNPKEEVRLKTDAYQEKIAQALMNGIKQYYQLNAPRNLPVATSDST